MNINAARLAEEKKGSAVLNPLILATIRAGRIDSCYSAVGRKGWSSLDPIRILVAAECLACCIQAQKRPGSNGSRDAVLGKLFAPIVPLFTEQQNW